MKNKVIIIGGGTYEPISNHLGICSLAKGHTSRLLFEMFEGTKLEPELHLSKIAADYKESYSFTSNRGLDTLIKMKKDELDTKMIILSAAVCDRGWLESQEGITGISGYFGSKISS